MDGVLKGIKHGEVHATKSAPNFGTFREHYAKVAGRARTSAIREDNCLKHWERFLGADINISQITSRHILDYRGELLERGLSASTALRAKLRGEQSR